MSNTPIITFYLAQHRSYILRLQDTSKFWVLWFLLLPATPQIAYSMLGFFNIFPMGEAISRLVYISVGITLWLWFSDCLLLPAAKYRRWAGAYIRGEISLWCLLTGWLPERFSQLIVQCAFVLFVLLQQGVDFGGGVIVAMAWIGVSSLLFICCGCLLAILDMVFPDITNLVHIIIRFMIFVSAVIFPIPETAIHHPVWMANPFFVTIESTRQALVLNIFQIDVAHLFWILLSMVLTLIMPELLKRISTPVRDYLQ